MFNMSIQSPALSTAAADSQTPWLSCPWWLCSGLFLLSISQGQNPQRGGQLPKSTATGALGEQLIPSTSCPSHPHPLFSKGTRERGKWGTTEETLQSFATDPILTHKWQMGATTCLPILQFYYTLKSFWFSDKSFWKILIQKILQQCRGSTHTSLVPLL